MYYLSMHFLIEIFDTFQMKVIIRNKTSIEAWIEEKVRTSTDLQSAQHWYSEHQECVGYFSTTTPYLSMNTSIHIYLGKS